MHHKEKISITNLSLKFNGLEHVQITDRRNKLLKHLIQITTTTTIKTIAINPLKLTGSSASKLLNFWFSKPNGYYQYSSNNRNDCDLKLCNITAFGH